MSSTIQKPRASRVGIAALALATLTAACSSDDTSSTATDPPAAASPSISEPATTEPATTEPATTEPATTEPADFPRSVTHALGTTDVPAEPERVVALDRSLVDAALALELELVGYTTYQDPNGSLPEYFGEALTEHASEATWVGDLLSPNLEAIAALDPDLILTSAVRHEAIYSQLSEIAPTIATASAGGGWKENILVSAEATGRDDFAQQLIADYEARAAALGAAVNEAAGDPEISVVRFLDVIRLYQPTSFSGVVLADAGLARPESQRDPEEFIRVISEEELALADGDVLIYTVFDDEAAEEQAAAIQDRPLWGTLDAVQRGDVHAVSDDHWMSGVGLFGAHLILDNLARIFGVTG